MPARRSAVLRIDYQKHWFVIGAFAALLAFVYGAYSYYIALEDFTRGFWILMDVVLGLLLGLFLVPPIFTTHMLGEKGLGIRMGLLMNTTVPYSWISGVSEASIPRGGLTVGIGVRYSRIMSTVFVTSSFRGLVTITLGEAHHLGGAFRPDVDRIVLSVKDRTTFIKEMKNRLGLREEE